MSNKIYFIANNEAEWILRKRISELKTDIDLTEDIHDLKALAEALDVIARDIFDAKYLCDSITKNSEDQNE